MSNFNQAILIGNLGKDPEIISTGSKPPFAKVQLATNKRWKKDGEVYERTDWHTVLFNGNLCKIACDHLHLGDRIFVTGELASQKWLDKDGKKRTSIVVKAKELRFLTPKPKQTTEEEDEDVTTVATDESEGEEDVPF